MVPNSHPQIFLHIAAPLAWIGPRPKSELISNMAAHLLRLGAMGSEAEAIRALACGPYRLGDVAALAGDALYAARQKALASAMAQAST
jgi:hypothetical protein